MCARALLHLLNELMKRNKMRNCAEHISLIGNKFNCMRSRWGTIANPHALEII